MTGAHPVEMGLDAPAPLMALTVHQPYASLIMVGGKAHEFRTRRPPAALIGQRIGIHAGARPADPGTVDLLWRAACDGAVAVLGTNRAEATARARALLATARRLPSVLPTGVLLGTVLLGTPVRAVDLLGRDFGSVTVKFGAWAWPVTDPVPLDHPLPLRGNQGFWPCAWPAELV